MRELSVEEAKAMGWKVDSLGPGESLYSRGEVATLFVEADGFAYVRIEEWDNVQKDG